MSIPDQVLDSPAGQALAAPVTPFSSARSGGRSRAKPRGSLPSSSTPTSLDGTQIENGTLLEKPDRIFGKLLDREVRENRRRLRLMRSAAWWLNDYAEGMRMAFCADRKKWRSEADRKRWAKLMSLAAELRKEGRGK